MRHRTEAVDPDPVSIALSVAGLLGGLVSALELLQQFRTTTPIRAHLRVRRLLESAHTQLTGLERDITAIETIVAPVELQGIADAGLRSKNRQVWMQSEPFRRYEQASLSAVQRLRPILKLTHRIDRLVSALPSTEQQLVTRTMADIADRLESVLRERTRSPFEVLSELRLTVRIACERIDELLGETGPSPSVHPRPRDPSKGPPEAPMLA